MEPFSLTKQLVPQETREQWNYVFYGEFFIADLDDEFQPHIRPGLQKYLEEREQYLRSAGIEIEIREENHGTSLTIKTKSINPNTREPLQEVINTLQTRFLATPKVTHSIGNLEHIWGAALSFCPL